MSAYADWELEDIHCNFRDLLPTDIGKNVNKPELYCKLCKVQTTSFKNFRDHLKGKGHKNALEAFRQGKKVIGKRKRTAVSFSEIGQKSISMDMVEGLIEPIVGLSYITEYHSLTGIVCVCNLCGVKFDSNVVVSHVTGSKHRLHYLKEKKLIGFFEIKSFGGKKSEMSAYLGQLTMDAEKVDGRGIPTIKIFELRDSSQEAEDEFIPEDKDIDEACRMPGATPFQNWVNKEFNRLRADNANCLLPISGATFCNIIGESSGNSATIHGNPVYYNTVSNDYYRTPHQAYGSVLHHNPQHYQPYPYPYCLQHGLYNPFSQPFLNPHPIAQTQHGLGFSYPELYLDPGPCTSVGRIVTYPDPVSIKNISSNTDAVPIDKVEITSGDEGSSGNTVLKEFHPKSVCSRDAKKSADPTKVDRGQWEKDIQDILGQNTNAKPPDSLAYSSTKKSPSATSGDEGSRGNTVKKEFHPITPSPSFIRGSELKKGRELSFSKSYFDTLMPKTPPFIMKEEIMDYPEYSQSKLIQNLLSEKDAELQAEKIADLLFQMSQSDGGAIQRLLANADIQEAQLASKAMSE